MLSALETGFGLDVVLWLQAHGGPLSDDLARALHYLGGNAFYALLAAVVFLFISREAGVRLLLALLLCIAVSNLCKELFQTPRPYVVSDRVVTLVEQSGYGLPSGHVMTALVMWGAMALRTRRRAAWIAAVGYALLMGWARMYAGVHYPQDVISALLLGAPTLWLYTRYAGPLVGRRTPTP